MFVAAISPECLSPGEKARMYLDWADQAQKAADRASAERYIDLAYEALSGLSPVPLAAEAKPAGRAARSRAARSRVPAE